MTCSAMKFWKKRSGAFLLELLAERRVPHVGVERHHSRVNARRVLRSRSRTLRESQRCHRGYRPAARRFRMVRGRVTLRSVCESAIRLPPRSPCDRLILESSRLEFGVTRPSSPSLSGLPCHPSFLCKRDAAALERSRHDHRRTPASSALRRTQRAGRPCRARRRPWRASRRPANVAHTHPCRAPHRRPALPERLTSMMPHRLSSRMKRCDLRGFPYRSFCGFTVAEQDVRAVVGADPSRVERDTHGRANALAERSGGNVDERKPRRRMALEVGANLRAASAARPGERPTPAHARKE